VIGLFVLLPALSTASLVHANPSIYANCTGGGWSLDVGVQPGPNGTDLVQLTVDDGRSHISAFEAAVTGGHMRRTLAAGLAFDNKTTDGDHASLKLDGRHATWNYQNETHALTCERI